MNGQTNHPQSMGAAQDCGLIILRQKDLHILYLNPAMAQAAPDARPGLPCRQVWPKLFTPSGELAASLAIDDGANRLELCAAPLEWAGEPALAITLRPPAAVAREETQRQLKQAQHLYRAAIESRAEVLLEYDPATDSFIAHAETAGEAIRTVVVFDYDLTRDRASFSAPFFTQFGRAGEIDRAAWRIGQSDLIHQADRQVALRIIEKCRQEPVGVKGSLRLKTRQGRYAWFELYATALWDEQKTRCLNIVGKLINIDELKTEATQWREQAKLDALTGLYNRAALQELAAGMLAGKSKKPGALIFIDIDDFKAVNDPLGHAAGDEVLHTIAQRIRRCFRQEDLTARYGGDEFVVYLQSGLTREALEGKLHQLQAIFHGDPLLRRFNSSASMGVARFPEDAGDFAALLQRADRALYCAKQLGKDRYAFYADCQQAGLV